MRLLAYGLALVAAIVFTLPASVVAFLLAPEDVSLGDLATVAFVPSLTAYVFIRGFGELIPTEGTNGGKGARTWSRGDWLGVGLLSILLLSMLTILSAPVSALLIWFLGYGAWGLKVVGAMAGVAAVGVLASWRMLRTGSYLAEASSTSYLKVAWEHRREALAPFRDFTTHAR